MNTGKAELEAGYQSALEALVAAEWELKRAPSLEKLKEEENAVDYPDGLYRMRPLYLAKSGRTFGHEDVTVVLDQITMETILDLNRRRKVEAVAVAQKAFQMAATLRVAE